MPARRMFAALFFLLAATASLPALAQDDDETPEVPSVDEVIAKLDDLYRADSSHGTIEMRIESDRGTRTLEVEQWSKGDEKALMVIRSPAREAGTATLRNEKGLWNYAPRADRLIRIPSGLLSENWMGSHFTNDDLMRETSFHDDYKSDIEWAEVDGTRRLKVTLTPRPKAPVVWEKIEYLMTADEWLPLRADFYDDGEVVRIMRFSNVKEFDGRKIPAVMELLPQTEGEKGEKTRVEYKEIKFDVGVDDGLFTQRGLRRVARQR